MNGERITSDEAANAAEDARERLRVWSPTPEQIAAECKLIQAGWSDVTRSGRKKPERPVDYSTVHRVVSEDE